MRELILLRHAEAAPGVDGKDDRERKLTEHGKREAQAAGQWLAEHHVKYDRVLCSPAQRTKETAALALGQVEPVFAEEIYDATPGDLYELLDEQGDAERVVLVGHNPGIEQLVAFLVEGRSEDYRGMPPGGMARLSFAGGLQPGSAKLETFWSPPN
ncbi:SixA phosphatase family protein [Luteibacter aegosomatissinici]|uniref:SixA phosphatase family protein n=1 Tax=Luteibacter aegosomatissinici TaxID=2911539 RepID=UPI001FF7AAEC|nr:histidine phosphatase family protein [Luteibacter aegosomatissinici]UPG94286.1 histidine phosphatase family protein [Luteibacter aegosomatissinici]